MGADVLLESQENGIASFLVGGGGAGVCTLVGGGGPHGMPGRFPERPFVLEGSFGGGIGTLVLFSSEVIVVERDLSELASLEPPNCTSSKDDVERRRAVSSGEFGRASPDVSFVVPMFSGPDGSAETVGSCEARGVVAADEDGWRLVREQIDVEDLESRDSGRDVAS